MDYRITQEQLWRTAKKPNLNKIQTFQNIITPPFVSNLILHKELGIKAIEEEAVLFYKIISSILENSEMPCISCLISWKSSLQTQKKVV